MEKETKTCSNCYKEISVANFQIHELQCKRHRTICEKCGEAVPKDSLEQHIKKYHQDVECELCHELIKPERLAQHKSDECSHRPVLCKFCDLDYPMDELDDHLDVCGSRTDRCSKCDGIVMLKEMDKHVASGCDSKTTTAIYAGRQYDYPGYGSQYDRQYSDRGYGRGYPLVQSIIFFPPGSTLLPKVLNTDAETSRYLGGGDPDRNRDSGLPSTSDYNAIRDSNADEDDNSTSSKNEDKNDDEDAEHKLPCEFCSKLFYIEKLDDHQVICKKNPYANQPMAYIKFLPPNKQTKPCECEKCRKFYEEDEKEESLLPCQFCEFPCPPSQLRWHELRCPKQPPPEDVEPPEAEFDPMTDPLPDTSRTSSGYYSRGGGGGGNSNNYRDLTASFQRQQLSSSSHAHSVSEDFYNSKVGGDYQTNQRSARYGNSYNQHSTGYGNNYNQHSTRYGNSYDQRSRGYGNSYDSYYRSAPDDQLQSDQTGPIVEEPDDAVIPCELCHEEFPLHQFFTHMKSCISNIQKTGRMPRDDELMGATAAASNTKSSDTKAARESTSLFAGTPRSSTSNEYSTGDQGATSYSNYQSRSHSQANGASSGYNIHFKNDNTAQRADNSNYTDTRADEHLSLPLPNGRNRGVEGQAKGRSNSYDGGY